MTTYKYNMSFEYVDEIKILNPVKQRVGRPSKSVGKKKERYGLELVYCNKCQCLYQKRITQQHKRTKKHQNNLIYV